MVVPRVDDVDAAVRALRERDVAVGDASDRPAWGTRAAHLRDPDGYLVELAADLAG